MRVQTPRERPLILVADDDDMQRFLFRETLEAAGFATVEATDGREAIAATADALPDLVVLDVVMPHLDGFAACRAIRQDERHRYLPILMATGQEDVDAVKLAYQSGATDFIAKPINWTLLSHRIRYMHRASRAFAELQESQSRLAQAEQIAHIGNWEWSGGDHLICSDEVLRLLGVPLGTRLDIEDLLGFVHADDRYRVEHAIREGLAADRRFDLDFRIVRHSGSEHTLVGRGEAVEGGSRLLGTFQDITERRRTEAQMQHLALHDSLTDLPNRVLFRDRFQAAISRAKRDAQMVALLSIDIDRFKEVNDTLGHAVGDSLLKEIGTRLLSEVRGSDTVARLGGDEFAVVQVNPNQPDSAEHLAQRLITALNQPFTLDGHEIAIGSSIGISVYPDHGADPEQLLLRADVALYRAKSEGRGRSRVFAPGMDVALRVRKELEGDLRRGLSAGWFELHFQPLVAAASNTLQGAEALLRLRHPRQGLMLPGEFIPVAEETGLIVPIGRWVLQEACRQARTWHDLREGPPVRVSVNLSPIQLRQPDIIDDIRSALEASALPPTCLELEITESVLMHETASTLEILGTLRELGIRIAMDDFGTGYSSLSYLQLFPFDRIKIDQSFVREVTKNPDAAAIVRSVVALSHSLGIRATAEGVETVTQLSFLKNQSCDDVQGYYFGRPIPAEEFTETFLSLEHSVSAHAG